MPPRTRTQFSLRRPVYARVKAALGGKEGAPLPLLLWKWQVCSWRLSSGWLTLQTPGAWAPSPPPRGSRRRRAGDWAAGKGPGRRGLEDEKAGQGCAIAILTDGEQSANPRLSRVSSCRGLLPLSISSHT